ncbi:MAG TPA: WXG100 family type VII secretion target [Promineifilum sp.]|nr:WXG100 family type VII secretion target [Promineifilum sp.]
MAELIQVDYEKLDQAHKKFTEQAEAFDKTLRDVRAKLEPLQGGKGWMGDAADAFFKEMDDVVLPSSTRLHKAFNDAAGVIKRIGDTAHKAEQDAISAFKLG